LLSAAPIYLQNLEKLDGIRTNFYVSNYGSFGQFPFVPPQLNAPYIYW